MGQIKNCPLVQSSDALNKSTSTSHPLDDVDVDIDDDDDDNQLPKWKPATDFLEPRPFSFPRPSLIGRFLATGPSPWQRLASTLISSRCYGNVEMLMFFSPLPSFSVSIG